MRKALHTSLRAILHAEGRLEGCRQAHSSATSSTGAASTCQLAGTSSSGSHQEWSSWGRWLAGGAVVACTTGTALSAATPAGALFRGEMLGVRAWKKRSDTSMPTCSTCMVVINHICPTLCLTLPPHTPHCPSNACLCSPTPRPPHPMQPPSLTQATRSQSSAGLRWQSMLARRIASG
jgi:hypothetical protein